MLSALACSPVGTCATPGRRVWSRREPSAPGSPGPCAKPSAASSAEPTEVRETLAASPEPSGGKYTGIPGNPSRGWVAARHLGRSPVKNTQQSPPRLGIAPPRSGAQHPPMGAGMDKRSRRGPSAPRARRRRPAGRGTTAPARFLHCRNVVSIMFHQHARQDVPTDAERGAEGDGSDKPQPDPGST